MGHEMIARNSGAGTLFAAVAICIACAGGAAAQNSPYAAALADIAVSSDTDGFRASRARAGALHPYANPWSYAGAVAQTTLYTQGDFRKQVDGIVGLYRDQRRDTLAGVEVEAGVARVTGHLRPIGDATWRLTPASGTAVDLTASADLVEAPKALDRGIGYTFIAAGMEQQFGSRLTATGLAGWQSFSDGNARPHLRARLIWLAVPEEGITLQLRYRQYSSRDADVGGAYFNPDTYRQWLAAAAIRKRHAGWTFSATLGAGQEQAANAESRASYLAEARVETPIAGDVRLVLRASYNRAAGFIDSPGYAYRIAGATLVLPFR
jgi:hypothetical protein